MSWVDKLKLELILKLKLAMDGLQYTDLTVISFISCTYVLLLI